MQLRPGILVVCIYSCLIAGCGQSTIVNEKTSSVCVDIPNGQYFQFVDGRLVATSSAAISAQERPIETARRIGATLAGMGYPWVTLSWDGNTAVVSGTAMDENSRSDAYIAAKSALEADPVSGPLVERVINDMDVYTTEDALALRLTEELVEEDGLDWLRIGIAGRVAILDGVANTTREKELGYSVGRSTVLSDLAATRLINMVVDAIQVRGQTEPVGAALISLSNEASVNECQTAFDAIMEGREVAFETNESIVKNSSSRLLDAITGAALLCDTHDIEIAGHAGDENIAVDAIDLTQRRASAIRDYLMAYQVEADRLSARGYGNIGPVAMESEGDADLVVPNIAFIVRARDS